MARDYLIIYVNIYGEKDFMDFSELTKKYDDKDLKTLMFPKGLVDCVELLRSEDEE